MASSYITLETPQQMGSWETAGVVVETNAYILDTEQDIAAADTHSPAPSASERGGAHEKQLIVETDHTSGG